MNQSSKVKEYLQALTDSERLGGQVVFRTVLPPSPARWSDTAETFSAPIRRALQAAGIKRLYEHQGRAINRIRGGQNVIVATPTASGKSLIYNLPVLERFQAQRESKNLYIFPLKALAQDQLKVFRKMAAHFTEMPPTAEIYDGDTSGYRRKCIREALPNIILTNPEMLHLSFLAYHRQWADFFKDLQTVVVDEVHTYRGLTGSHVAQLFRRFDRICRHYGSSPRFVFSSATVADPARLARQLTGQPASAIIQSGAPKGRRHVVFINPNTGPAHAAILLLQAALHRELRTIVYTQSRKLTELISLWAAEQSRDLANRISAYRAGFRPEERREIEARLANGDLLAVISTSALELGIDIGDLDLCILVGYPGSVVSTWQRGGRVGRSGQESALVLIAGENALDQFFMRHPDDFMRRRPESAVVNPNNPEILARHLECAAAELPLKMGEPMTARAKSAKIITRLVSGGQLLRSADGQYWYSRRKIPHRQVDIRGSGNRFEIVDRATGRNKGEIDEFRAFRETHPGAIYLHRGDTYLVDSLDLNSRTVKVSRAEVDYYTQVRGFKETEILEVNDQKSAWGAMAAYGRLKVTDQTTAYEIRRIHGKNLIEAIELDLPPQIFETEGMWFQIPRGVHMAAESNGLDFMGAIHAIEHAAIGVFPLLVMADRNDLGGLATPYHPVLNGAAIFIYDGVVGGAGLNREAFKLADSLLQNTLDLIQSCSCESGCPSCVQSPKCGSGNRPIDKAAAIFVLEQLKRTEASTAPTCQVSQSQGQPEPPLRSRKQKRSEIHYGVFDLETQKSAADVGGWHRAHLMKISCAVLFDSRTGQYADYAENQIPRFLERLQAFDLVIGFNIKRFDYQVLKGYTDFDFMKLNTLDILEEVKKHLGFRLSLNHLAKATLDARKTADGLQALRWWQQGKMLEIIAYCRQDVKITADLYRFGREKGYLLFMDRNDQKVRIPVEWQ